MMNGIAGTSIAAVISAEFRHPWPRTSIQAAMGTAMLRPIASTDCHGYSRYAWLKIFNGGCYRRCEVEPGAGEEAFEEAGPVLHPFEPGLGQGGELGEVAFGQVGQ